MATGTTNDFNYSRDDIINAALRKCGALAVEDVADAARLQEGIKHLNGIVKALDLRNPNIWKIPTEPLVVFLAASTWRYTMSANWVEVVEVVYRDAQGEDWPLTVLNAKDYAQKTDKFATGEPEEIYLPIRRDLASIPEITVWPALNSVTATSVVTGTNALNFSCVAPHTASSDNRPITGTNYAMYWTQTGNNPDTWTTDTDYTCGEQIRMTVKQPLTDFDLADDNADLPAGFGLYLIYRLANDWADDFGLPLEERGRLERQMRMAYDEVFPYHLGTSDNYHNRGTYC